MIVADKQVGKIVLALSKSESHYDETEYLSEIFSQGTSRARLFAFVRERDARDGPNGLGQRREIRNEAGQ